MEGKSVMKTGNQLRNKTVLFHGITSQKQNVQLHELAYFRTTFAKL